MHIDTRELIKKLEGELTPEGFMEVPERLKSDAREQLGENLISRFVTRKQASGRNLLAWAKNERNKRKRARKAARKARKGKK